MSSSMMHSLAYPVNNLLFTAVNAITELIFHMGLGGMGRIYVPLMHLAFFAAHTFRPPFWDYHLARREIETDHHFLQTSYDFIIVGGGLAGCIAANRLSTKYSVLLVHGPGALPNILTRVPLMILVNQGDTSHDHLFAAEPSWINLQWKTKGIMYNTGKVLGGSSVLSGLIYSMGRKADYEEWVDNYGAVGFDHATLWHYAKWHTTAYGSLQGQRLYGRSGEFEVTHAETPSYYQAFQKAFLHAASYITGTQIVLDHNEESLGFGPAIRLIEKESGYPSHPLRAFLERIRHDPNRRLHVILEALVEHIGIVRNDEGKLAARGVIVKFNDGLRRYFFANKKIVLAAGAVGTPQLLMMSGIGPLDELEKWDIPVKLHREGVGRNLHDHYDIGTAMVVFPKGKGYVDFGASDLLEFFVKSKGAVLNPYGINSLGFFRSRNTSYSTCLAAHSCKPDFEIFVHTVGVTHASAGAMWRVAGMSNEDLHKYFYKSNGGRTFRPKESILLTPTLLHPTTRGRIRLRDLSIETSPRIYLNVLDNERDLQMAAELYLVARAIGIKAFGHLGGEWMDVRQEGCPGADDSFEYARCTVQRFLKTAWHLGGTARIGFRHDPLAVVDNRLNVIGVDNLSIIDASVIPTPVSGHMIATIAAIAEKWCDDVHNGQA